MIFKALLLTFLVLNISFAQQSLIVTSQSKQNRVADTEALINHLISNQQARAVIVEPSKTQNTDVIELAQQVLQELNIDAQDVSSFLADNKEFTSKLGDLMNRFESVDPQNLKTILEENPNTVIHFSRRLLEGDDSEEETKSKLFTNMTPEILSGLLVALFLMITLCIGVSCLYDVKTNDKFARNNLWVGKQS